MFAFFLCALMQTVDHHPMAFDLGDFQAKGELTHPKGATGKLPVVILVHGTGPSDMDATFPKVALFKELAEALSSRGFAVLRYNKHYVNGPSDFDRQSFFTKTSTQVFVQDLDRVIGAIEKDPRLDAKRVFLYGWSEGTAVAAAAAVDHPEVAGLVLQGPVGVPWHQIIRSWFSDVAIPYLHEVAHGSSITTETLKAAQLGRGGAVAKMMLPFFADPEAYQSGKLAISARLDRDGSGALDIDKELVPAVEQMTAFAEEQTFPVYGKAAIPSVDGQVGKLPRVPVLIIEGERDASTPSFAARSLAQKLTAAAYRVELKMYPGLGHALCSVPSVTEDDVSGPVAESAVTDIVSWLKQAVQ